MTTTGPVVKRCPYADELDEGTLTLVFDVPEGGDGPELHALALDVGQWRDEALSHEAFTREVKRATGAASALSTWTTAGLTVTVEA